MNGAPTSEPGPRTSAEDARPTAPPNPRLDALLAMVEADPEDATARLLLGGELLAAGRSLEAIPHLERYVEAGDRENADTGAAWLSLARARRAAGNPSGALAALETGARRATAHRHAGLAAAIEAERAVLRGDDA